MHNSLLSLCKLLFALDRSISHFSWDAEQDPREKPKPASLSKKRKATTGMSGMMMAFVGMQKKRYSEFMQLEQLDQQQEK